MPPSPPQPEHRPQTPDVSVTPIARSPGKLLHDAQAQLRTGLARTLAWAGCAIPGESWAVLNLLWDEDDLAQVDIARRIGRDRHQTSRLVDTLCRHGLVTREASAEDSRIKRVVLTDSGRAAKTPLRRAATRYLEETFAGISQADYDGFIRCLQRIIEAEIPPRRSHD